MVPGAGASERTNASIAPRARGGPPSAHESDGALVLDLEPVSPFRLDLTAWALRRRRGNAVDRWDGRTYRRALVIDGRAVEVAVEQTAPASRARLRATVTGEAVETRMSDAIAGQLDRALGLEVRLSDFYRFAHHDARLARLVTQFRGLKPPRFPSTFEALLNGIACQQLSLVVGIELLNRLSRRFGGAVRHGHEIVHTFPEAARLADAKHDTLRRLGFSGAKARAIVENARGVASGALDLEGLVKLDDQSALARLDDLPGVGRWTAEYVLLRGLGRVHMFPGDDVGARNALRRWLGRRGPLDYRGVGRTLAKWSAYAGLIYFHLLLKGLSESGELQPAEQRREAG